MLSSWILITLHLPSAYAGHHEFNDKTMHVKLGVDIPGYDVQFDGQDQLVKYTPNANSLFSVGVALQEYIGLTWGFRNPQSSEDKVKKGNTDYEDWRLNFAFKQFHVKLFFSRYQGFYIEDSKAADPTWDASKPYVQSPDLISQHMGANFTWILRPEKFSLVAVYDQTQRQEVSGGSWLVGAALAETLFKDQDEILPAVAQGSFGNQQNITEGKFQAITAKAGYGYTGVLEKKYFASAALMAGFGRQYMKIKGTDFSDSRWAQASKVDLLLSIGYNGDDYYSGLFVSADGTKYNTGEMDIEAGAWMARLYFGFRL